DRGEPAARDAELGRVKRQTTALSAEMARRMGALRLQGDRVQPGGDAEIATEGGYVVRKGTTVTVRDLSFRHLPVGLPTLADWLGRSSGSMVRYQFKEVPFGADEDDDREP